VNGHYFIDNMASKRKTTQDSPTAAAALVATAAGKDDAESSDDDSDEEFTIAEDASQDQLNIPDIIQTAQQERVMPITRAKYVAHLRQMACWAQSSDQFMHCVFNGEMRTPLNEDCMVGYTQHLRNRKVIWPHHEVAGTLKHLAVKTVSGFFAAAKDTYAFHGQPFPDSIEVYFSNFIRAYSLFIASQKDKGLHPDKTNSIGFSSSVYERICRKGSEYFLDCRGSCVSAWRQVWLYWLLLYNLLGRNLQVSRIKYDWIWWQDDCMVIKVPTQKSDQDGLLSYWKRVFSNPFKPWMCPVLALAVHVFSQTPADPFTNCVFTGAHGLFRIQFKKFMNWAFPEDQLEGIPIARITSHSPKRSGICLVNGNEVVKWDAAELRADHKIGISSVYQTCAAPQQDGIMGRLLAGLEFASAEFTVAPPHFKTDDVAEIQFKDFVAHYEYYPETFKTVIPFLLASIVFHMHSGRLRSMLPKGHPFWSSTLVLRQRSLLLALNSKVLGGKVGAKSVLKLSGNSVIGDTRTDVAEIKTDVAEIKQDVKALVVSKFGSVGGLVGSVSDVGVVKIQEQLNSIQEELRCVRQKLDCPQDVVAAAGAKVVMPRRCVPVLYLSNSFQLSSCTPFNLLTRWVTPEPPVPAWRHIRNEMLPRSEGRRSQENLLSVYNHFMQALMGCNPNISDVEANLDSFFEVAWSRMARVCEWDSGRSAARSTKTVYNWLLAQPEKLKLLKDSKLIVSVSFEAEAARSARFEREKARSAVEMSSSIDAEDMMSANAGAGDVMISIVHAPEALPPQCVPRNALLYHPGAPRPLPQRKGQARSALNDIFDSYIAQNAPKEGARPCWPCPFCLTARHLHTTLNLSRHMRDVHSERRDAEKELVMARSDVACLVWCCNRGGASRWEPVLQ